MEQDARVYAESIVDTVQESLLILDKHLRVISANSSFYSTFQVSPEETQNKIIYDIGRIYQEGVGTEKILLAIEDVTELKLAAK